MTETSGDTSGGSWLGSWIQAAKEKSAEAISFVKKDLAEFTTTMQDDSARVAATMKEKLTQENASHATEKVRQGMTSLIGGISKALIVEPSDNYRPARIIGGEAVVFDRQKARLHALQTNPSTYTEEPTDQRYHGPWTESFSVDNKKGEISELLVSNVEVRGLYTQLVPITVSNVDFWRRYYYRLQLLEEDEARRRELKKRAELSCQLNDNDQLNADIDWDDDDDDDDDNDYDPRTTGTTSSSSPLIASPETSTPSPADPADTVLTHSTDPAASSTCASSCATYPLSDKQVASSHVDNQRQNVSISHDSVASISESSTTLQKAEDSTTGKESVTLLQGEVNNDSNSTCDLAAVLKGINMAEASSTENDEVKLKPEVTNTEKSQTKQAECSSKLRTDVVTKEKEQMISEVQNFEGVKKKATVGSITVEVGSKQADSTNAVAKEQITHASSVVGDQILSGNNSARTTPSDAKESTDDDWEKDFDVEVTEEDLKTAQAAVDRRAAAATAGSIAAAGSTEKDDKADDWEEW